MCAALLLLVAACSTAELKRPGATEPEDIPVVEDEPGGDTDGAPGEPAADAGHGQGTVAPPPATSAVTIQVQPSDSGAALLGAIRGARKSVHLTMYLLTDTQIIDALGAAKRAGRDVKVILNQRFPTNGGSNDDAYAALKSRGVPVVWSSPGFDFTHAKTLIVDGTSLIVMTMNMTFSSAKTNREFIATNTDPDDIKDAETIFDADYRRLAVQVPTTKLVLSPDTTSTNPPQPRLRQLIESAKSSVDVEVQSLSDAVLVDAVIAAHQAKLAVRVVLDADTLRTTGQRDALAKMKAAGVPVRGVRSPDIHAKAIVVDDALAFVGSQNFTPTALTRNREVGVITNAATEVAKVTAAVDSDFARGTVP